MNLYEPDTAAHITPEMINDLVEALGQSPEVDKGFGAEFIVRADRLQFAISILEQVAHQL
jgi:hypothetical protein